MALLRVYRALFVAQVQNASQYRLQSVLWLLFSVIRPVIFLAAWSAVARAQGGSVQGMTPADFATYYLTLTLVSQLTQSWNAWDFEFEVRNGTLSSKLLRPLHPIHYAVVENVVWKLVTIVVLLPVLVVLAWSFEARFATTQPWQVVAFATSVLVAAALRFVFWWSIACAAFWTTRVHAVAELTDRLTFVFGGIIGPIGLLPGVFQYVAYALPFGYMLGVPADILRGGASPQTALLLIGGQLGWLGLSWLALQWAWRRGVRQYAAVGA